MSILDDWIARAQQERVSDVHIVAGLPVRGRVDGRLMDLTDTPMSWEDCENIGRELAGSRFSEIELMGEVDLAKSFSCGVRTRINLFRQLQLPPAVSNFENYRTGIVLVTGETGSGKSTTLASVLNRINHTRQAHIITLEDPIEDVYTPDKCIINQRQIGADTRSYADGLRSILREDPDVILIGEMRDLNTIETALTAAETGHLVFATLHTNSAADAIDRIVNVFPEGQQKQIRLQLSTTLRAVLSQQLLPRRSGKGRIAACEVMIVNSAIRNLIREGKTPQMESFIATNAQNGSILMDAALQRLVRDGSVSQQVALSYARDPENFGKLR